MEVLSTVQEERYGMERKRKQIGYIYLPVSQFHEAEGHLKLRSYVHDDIINSAPSIGNFIDKHESYNQLPPRIVKHKP